MTAEASQARQPVHVVYGGAHLFRADTADKLGSLARRVLAEEASTGQALADVLGLAVLFPASPGDTDGQGDAAFANALYAAVDEKLRRAPVEDLRIDFEDGFGPRPDDEEDRTAVQAAREVARGLAEGTLPPLLGLRIKALSAETERRALRTLSLFFATMLEASGGAVPKGFVVTLPKVTHAAEVGALAAALAGIERQASLGEGTLAMELMAETPEAIVAADGRLALGSLIDAGGGRVRGVHFGAYDYTAALGIAAPDQTLDHEACRLARGLLQLGAAGRGVWLSDGATTTLPVGPHKARPGAALASAAAAENRRAVRSALALHGRNIAAALRQGFLQGWDLHPAQLVARFGVTFAYFRRAAPAMAARLRHFVARAATASRVGSAFDDAATGQGLLNFFRQGVDTGALDAAEVERMTSVPVALVRAGSFPRILSERAGRDG